MASLVKPLSRLVGRTVLDETGLKGNYDFTLQWVPGDNPTAETGVGVLPQPQAVGFNEAAVY